jgi:hypothetical protein
MELQIIDLNKTGANNYYNYTREILNITNPKHIIYTNILYNTISFEI